MLTNVGRKVLQSSLTTTWRRCYATSIQFTPSMLPDGVLYKHTPTSMVTPDINAIKSTAVSLTEEQKTLLRKMRLEDPLKNNATYLAKYFGVPRTAILKIAPLSDEVRLHIFGIPTIPTATKKKVDIEKWKAMVRRKEHENWASRKDHIKKMKKFDKETKEEDTLLDFAAVKKLERTAIQRQFKREKTVAEDKELVRKGLLKGGILKANTFIRLDAKGKKKK